MHSCCTSVLALGQRVQKNNLQQRICEEIKDENQTIRRKQH